MLFSSNKGERKKIVKGKKRVKSFAHRNENTAITLFHVFTKSVALFSKKITLQPAFLPSFRIIQGKKLKITSSLPTFHRAVKRESPKSHHDGLRDTFNRRRALLIFQFSFFFFVFFTIFRRVKNEKKSC